MNSCRFLAIVLLLGVVAPRSARAQGPAAKGPAAAPKPALPGLQVGPAPWSNGVGDLSGRLDAIGLPAMPAQVFVQHIHQHLIITINGAQTTIPSQIGISRFPQFISPLHTHDTTGTIHIESATKETFTLGQFFDVWGVRFTTKCIGGYCARGADLLKVVSNGAAVTGDPRKLPLEDRQTIEVTFGASPKKAAGAR